MNIQQHVATLLTPLVVELGATDATLADIAILLAPPRDPSMGDLALPTFKLAKSAGMAPPAFAAALADRLQPLMDADPVLCAVTATGPFLNFRQDPVKRTQRLLLAVESEQFGNGTDGVGKTVGLDYSSPNIAKPFGIGHLRSTAIGHALARLHAARGYRVVGVNHLGDWGTQFGKLMASYEEFGDATALDANPIQHLYDLYVKFHQLAGEDPAWDDRGRDWFRRLEQGDTRAVAYWKQFRDLSLREFERIYARLDVKFDHYWGEAHYNEMLDDVIRDVEASGLSQVSDGALVVPLDDIDLPPCLIRKSDGATLYATRDIAAARYRYEQLRFDLFLYVVGAAQTVHFRQVFEVLARMGEECAPRLVHVPFGLIQGISTRKGTLVFLDDILNRGRDLARQILEDRAGLSDSEKDEIAEQVAIGAVIFQDLSRDRIKDYEFDWDAMLRGLRPGEPGRTGPYLQYTLVRLTSLLAHYREQRGEIPAAASVDASLLQESETQFLVHTLEKFPAVVLQAGDSLEPAVLSRYLCDAAEAFNAFYTVHKVVTDDAALTAARIQLVRGAHRVLYQGLYLLGMPRPTRM
jgi:arginyl-tRNA synthetase